MSAGADRVNVVGMLGTADQVASVASFLIAVVGLVILLRQRRPLTTAQRLDRLAEVVAAQWRDEVEIQGIAAPWTTVDLPASRRLVVVGPAGSGKTVAAVRLVRELLSGRVPGDPVAVLFALHSWDAAVHPHRWMAAELARTYRMRFAVALELVRARHIVPVLDGLDETVDPPAAIRALNHIHDSSAFDPLIITSREHVELTGATVAELGPVRVPGWEMLSSPLLLALALSSHTDPAELTGLTETELEEHLFIRFVPAVYADVPRPDGRRLRWNADRAERWLRFLARQSDLSWWELIRLTPRVVIILLAVLVVGPVTWFGLWLLGGDAGLASGVAVSVAGFVTLVAAIRPYPEVSRLRVGLRLNVYAVLGGFAFGFLLGLVIGLAAALATGVASAFMWGLIGRIDTGAQPRAVTPMSVLRSDRVVTIICGLPLPVTFATLILFAGSPLAAVGGLVAFWLFYGIGVASMTAWSWFGLTRVWLALHGRTPLRLMAFLDDAHRRGVLRRVGPTYEFRHARLRAHLRQSHHQAQLPAATQ